MEASGKLLRSTTRRVALSKGNLIGLTTSRQKVLAYVKKTGNASARGIARALKMSAPAVRHHLAILNLDGRIETVEPRRRGTRGRPEKVYSVSQAALGDNLPVLADALLTQLGTRVKLGAVANHILDAGEFTKLPIGKRLSLLVEKLSGMNYQPRWEAGGEGPRVIFGRCPYVGVVESHPELCKMDAALLERALGRTVLASAKKESKGRGLCPFIFRVV